MNRRGFLLCAAALAALPEPAAAARFERGLLWQVQRGTAPPSHLYGTIHVADPRLDALPAPVRKAFDGSKSLMLEFLADGYAKERFLEAALFTDGQTLEEKIGAEDFERALELLAPIGLPREFVNKLKPWGVLLNLRTMGEKTGDKALAGAAAPLDARLAALARDRRMPLGQIEGVEEQIFTFDECPMQSQVALLKHSLAHRDELLELGSRILEAYLARDLAAIWRLREAFAARHPEIAPHQAVFTQRVVYDRSVVMAFRMQRELRRGNAFIALGALHLHGSRGVPALLEADGFKARPVY
jgi:uncharacterized protein YbaP (TraB family)